MVGTRRGAFVLESDADRRKWQIRGPLADSGWSFNHMVHDRENGAIYAAGHSAWYGAAVWTSLDRGDTWTLSSEGITHGDAGPAINQIWNLTLANGALYAGVDPAGLFRSDDRGATWTRVGQPLLEHPTAPAWRPGKGGLCLHSIVAHPDEPTRLWVAIAGGGVLYSGDAGDTWEPRNPTISGGPAAGQPGYRVQKLAMAPGRPGFLYQQNHQGVFRSRDAGQSWADVTGGLPSPFGFPLVVHPHEAGTIYVIPHVNEGGSRYVPDGRIAVWRSRDGGDRWAMLTNGLPRQAAFVEVLRDGMATDGQDPAGLYFGTTGGHLYGSGDEGETWSRLADHLPEINSVSAAVVD